MECFPGNVEDVERWLPAGAFPEKVYRPNERLVEPDMACELTSSMGELALAILDETHHHATERIPFLAPSPQWSIQRYPPFVQPCVLVPGYPYKPSQPGLLKPILEATQLLPKASLKQTRTQSRGLPFRVVRSGARGFIRESGGTGVFLPRVLHTRDPCMRVKPDGKPWPVSNGGVDGASERHGLDVNSISIESSGKDRLSSEMSLLNGHTESRPQRILCSGLCPVGLALLLVSWNMAKKKRGPEGLGEKITVPFRSEIKKRVKVYCALPEL